MSGVNVPTSNSVIRVSSSGQSQPQHQRQVQFSTATAPSMDTMIQQSPALAPSLHDSRLVGVPTMGRVIPMTGLRTMHVPEMRIVLQQETKIEDDLSALMSESDPTSMVSESTGLLIKSSDTFDEELSQELTEKNGSSDHQDNSSITITKPLLSELRKITDKTFPTSVIQKFLTEYKTGTMYDAVWECDGGMFKVHRLVLAGVSPMFKQVLASEPEDVSKSVIYTPDFSSACVKALLCLFYTGKVNIGGTLMSEVNGALKMLQFHGENVTLLPSQSIIKQESEDLVATFSQPATERAAKNTCKDEMLADSDEDWDPKTDLAFDDDIQGDDEEEEVDFWEPRGKKRKAVAVKNETDDYEDEQKTQTGFKRGRKSLKTPDTREIYRTRGPGKGSRSYQLSLDLFDGRSVDFIHVCHACYKVFDKTKEFTLHKDDCHPDNPHTGPHHTDNKNEYLCPHCDKIICVKHIAWFSKHLKYCRVNNEIANNIVGPDDDLSDGEDFGVKRRYNKRLDSVETSSSMLKDSEERLRITGEAKGKNLQALSNVLVGKVVDFIWACKICYNVFLSEDALEAHKEVDCKPEKEFGEYWNPETQNYTCPHCNQVQNSRHLVWFIYHMKKCNMNSQTYVKREVNDTEDETDNEDDIPEYDPEQILLKPYQILTDRAEWICRSLIGRLVQTLYPCHICYQVFESPVALKQHFRANHEGLENTVNNGHYYNSDSQCFNCPVCNNDVCKNQTSSIKFIYHVKKCSGQTYTFKKSCDECDESFSQYKMFKSHSLQHTSFKSFMCHLCTKNFPSNARLNYHVQYVHSSTKPYSCDKCEKSYKRKAELQEHEEMSHSSHFNYSCDKCGKQFYGKKNLALHMKTHYTEEEKKHVCNICNHRFAKIKFLKNHMTVHSDIRQFACEVIKNIWKCFDCLISF